MPKFCSNDHFKNVAHQLTVDFAYQSILNRKGYIKSTYYKLLKRYFLCVQTFIRVAISE